jgi:hypothetical protein
LAFSPQLSARPALEQSRSAESSGSVMEPICEMAMPVEHEEAFGQAGEAKAEG